MHFVTFPNLFPKVIGAIACLFLGIISSCSDPREREIEEVLEFSATNSSQLLKVLNHYQNPSDSLKHRAAIFLIKNLKSQLTFGGEGLKTYDVFFQAVKEIWVIDSLDTRQKRLQIQKLADSLNILNATSKLQLEHDAKFVKSSYLIQNIDLAFKAWKEFPWSRNNVTFEHFCKYVLPYKVYKEPIGSWRQEVMNRFSWITDSMNNPNSLREATILINRSIRDGMLLSGLMQKLPLAVSFKNLERGRIGKCEHMVTLNIYLLRAMGIPARPDYVPQWGNGNDGHAWCSIVDESKELFAFDAIYYPKDTTDPSYNGVFNIIPESILRNRKAPKVYRHTYEEQQGHLLKNDLFQSGIYPDLFVNKKIQDVTKEYYTSTFDINIQIPNRDELKVVCLSVFNDNQWKMCNWSKSNSDEVYHFANMGSEIVYLPVSSDIFEIKSVSQPFYLASDGSINHLIPSTSKVQNLKVDRKYYIDYNVNEALKGMIGGVFEGANSSDFSDAQKLYEIDSIPYPRTNDFEIIGVKSKYRYLRFILPNNQCRVAELRFYGVQTNSKIKISDESVALRGNLISSKPSNHNTPYRVIDGNVLTYFVSDTLMNGWVGFDLGYGNRANVTRIEFYPPNDGNSVEIGDKYELFYWNDGWKSLGKQTADKEELYFENCPENALFVLRDLTKGKAERIFTYKNNRQVWR